MVPSRSKVVVVVGEGRVGSLLHLGGVLREEVLVDLHLSGGQGRGGDKVLVASLVSVSIGIRGAAAYQSGVADELARKPEEGLLEVVVGLGRDVVVLEVLFPVEGDGLGLHLALLDIDLVAAENDGDVLADTGEIT